MLTLPEIVERQAQPYVAVRVNVPFTEVMSVIDGSFSTLYSWLGAHGIAPSGAAFFKYNVIDMAGLLEIELAAPVASLVTVDTDAPVVFGVLAAGRYAQVTWTGPYQHLMEVNAVLIGWAKEKGIEWDMRTTTAGDRFESRVEIYENNPMEVDDPRDLVTTVAIKIAD